MTSTSPAPSSSPLLGDIIEQRFDVHLSRNHVVPCSVDATSMSWNGHTVEFSDIASVAYRMRRRSLNLIQSRIERRIIVGTPHGDLQIALGTSPFGRSNEHEQQGAYQAIVEALYERVEPRLRSEIIRSIAAGRVTQIGVLQLSHDSVSNTATGETIEWRQLPVAQIEGRRVVVRATVEHDGDPVCSMDMLTRGAVLLPELLADATIPFT